MVLAFIIAFALCWLPIHVLELAHCSKIFSDSFYSNHANAFNIARIIAHGLSYFNSCLNPFLYALLNHRHFTRRQRTCKTT